MINIILFNFGFVSFLKCISKIFDLFFKNNNLEEKIKNENDKIKRIELKQNRINPLIKPILIIVIISILSLFLNMRYFNIWYAIIFSIGLNLIWR